MSYCRPFQPDLLCGSARPIPSGPRFSRSARRRAGTTAGPPLHVRIRRQPALHAPECPAARGRDQIREAAPGLGGVHPPSASRALARPAPRPLTPLPVTQQRRARAVAAPPFPLPARFPPRALVTERVPLPSAPRASRRREPPEPPRRSRREPPWPRTPPPPAWRATASRASRTRAATRRCVWGRRGPGRARPPPAAARGGAEPGWAALAAGGGGGGNA